MLNVHSVAVEGIGFGPLALAKMGFIDLLEEAPADAETQQVQGPWRRWGSSARSRRERDEDREIYVVVRLNTKLVEGEEPLVGRQRMKIDAKPIKISTSGVSVEKSEITVVAEGPTVTRKSHARKFV